MLKIRPGEFIDLNLPDHATYFIEDDSLIGIDKDGHLFADHPGHTVIDEFLEDGETIIIDICILGNYLAGDANLDSMVNASDAETMLFYLAAKGAAADQTALYSANDRENEQIAFQNADTNGDCLLNRGIVRLDLYAFQKGWRCVRRKPGTFAVFAEMFSLILSGLHMICINVQEMLDFLGFYVYT